MLNVIEINNQIVALDRLSIYYSKTIEKWETADPLPKEGVAWLESRHEAINSEIARLLQLKQDLGLPL